MFNGKGGDTPTDRFAPTRWVHREPERRNSQFSLLNRRKEAAHG